MTRGRSAVATVALCVVVATAGCGLGAGESSTGEASLSVTRDYGAEQLVSATEQDPSGSETVLRFLDREAAITTRFGGGFVQSIAGIEGGFDGDRSTDWFFYVNGIESSTGAAEVEVRGGDRIWWDYRDWSAAMRVRAVVGSWPEPFAQASTASPDRLPVEIECMGAQPACDEVASRLADEDVDAEVLSGDPPGEGEALRVLVGTWDRLRTDPVAAQLDGGPSTSGVFARFEAGPGGLEAVALDVEAHPAQTYGPGAGLVAGLRQGEEPATWLVTGTDDAGVERAAGLLDAATLGDRYAMIATGDGGVAVPFEGPG